MNTMEPVACVRMVLLWASCGLYSSASTLPLNLTIGLLENPSFPVSPRVLDQLSGARNTSSVRYDVLSTRQDRPSTQLLLFVTRLACDGAVLLVAPSPCDVDTIGVLPLSRLPVVILYPDPLCFLASELHNQLLFHPSFWSVPEVVSALSRNRYDKVTVIYDSSIGSHLPGVASALEEALHSALGISTIYVTPETLYDIANSSGLHGPKSYAYNSLHVLWVSSNITTRLLTEVNKNVSVFTALDSLSHWLVVCTNQMCLEEVTDILPMFRTNVKQVAVLYVKRVSPETSQTTTAFTTVLRKLERGLEAAINDGYNVSSTGEPCQQIHSTIVETYLLPALGTSSGQKCGPYEVLIPDMDTDPPSLQPVPMCMAGGNFATDVDVFPDKGKELSGKHFQITTIESAPFVLSEEVNGTLQFYGMAIDMLRELSRTLNFTYSLSRVPDGQFGGIKDDGNWTGMVGQLQRKEVNMSIASLSVTSARATVMDFVEYYFEYGAGIMKKPDEDENKWRVIALPFRWPVWVGIMASVPFAGTVAWLITLAVHKTISGKRKPSDNFSDPGKSTWYTFGAVLTQGGHYLPESVSGRTFICHWWAFSIIIVASYGGSLIAYLTISKTDPPFDDLDGMIGQTRYKWGFREGTVYYSTFKNATGGVYKDLWDGLQEFVKDDPSVASRSASKHLSKVQEGDYVFMMDRTPLLVKVISDKACDLVLLTETFLPLPFGIGLQQGSPYKSVIAKGVKKLQQSGLIQFWEKKWWPKQSCSGIPIPEAHAVSLLDTQSAFYLLLTGVVAAAVVLFVEMIRTMCRGLNHKPAATLSSYSVPTPYTRPPVNRTGHAANGAVVSNGKAVANGHLASGLAGIQW